MTEELFDLMGEPIGKPEQSDNSARPEDGAQDVSQDPNVDYSLESVVPPLGNL